MRRERESLRTEINRLKTNKNDVAENICESQR